MTLRKPFAIGRRIASATPLPPVFPSPKTNPVPHQQRRSSLRFGFGWANDE